MENDIDSVISFLNDASVKMEIAPVKKEIILPKIVSTTKPNNDIESTTKPHPKVIPAIPPELVSKKPTAKLMVPPITGPEISSNNEVPATTGEMVGREVVELDCEEENEDKKGDPSISRIQSNGPESGPQHYSGAPALWIRMMEKDGGKGAKKVAKKRYLKFRPYVDPIDIRPYKPPDRGYYYKIYKGDVQLIKYTLEDNGFREAVTSAQEWSIMWSVTNMKSQVYQALKKYQKVNHFPRSIEITRKDCLCKNITKMQSLYGFRHFDFVPKTFVLPQEFPQLSEEMEKNPDVYWIVKPAASSQGKGIFVTDNINEIPAKTALIASRYINDPLLLDGYKFDMRIYLAITSIEPLRIYMYEEGLARFATCKYSPHVGLNKGNRFMHLTNYSVNKFNANFVANADPSADGVGSKWSLTALRKYFAAAGVKDDIIWKRIEEILIKSILAIEPIIKSSCDMFVPFKNNCFELLGFDILLDSSLNPWLLEVNLSPSLNCDAPLDQKIKGELIADLFTMIGIVPLDQRNTGEGAFSKNPAQLNPYAPRPGESKPLKSRKTYGKPSALKLGDSFKESGSKTLTNEERGIIKETDEEYKRRGKFIRIFPTPNYSIYKQFFEEERPSNVLLAHRLLKKLTSIPSPLPQLASETLPQKIKDKPKLPIPRKKSLNGKITKYSAKTAAHPYISS